MERWSFACLYLGASQMFLRAISDVKPHWKLRMLLLPGEVLMPPRGNELASRLSCEFLENPGCPEYLCSNTYYEISSQFFSKRSMSFPLGSLYLGHKKCNQDLPSGFAKKRSFASQFALNIPSSKIQSQEWFDCNSSFKRLTKDNKLLVC